MNVILASTSPRRRELLKRIFDDFEVIAPTINEEYPEDIGLKDVAVYLAELKAKDIYYDHDQPDDLIIAADTTVLLDDILLGKPSDEMDAKIMLGMLSGRTHKVITGVVVIHDEKKISIAAETSVSINKISEKEIDDYIKTGEPMDKAGAYAVQGYGSKFIKSVHGNYDNVVGLPVGILYDVLKREGIIKI